MGWTGWNELGGTTGNACAALATGSRLYVFSSGLDDKKIYYRSRGKDTGWDGWSEFGGTTDVALCAVSFAGKYHFFAKGLQDDKIYVRSTSTIPGVKTWAEFGGTTDVAVSAVAFDDHLFVFAVGKDNKIYAQKRTETGAWSGWSDFGGTTNAAVATVVFGGRLYVFSKGLTDNKIYFKSRTASGTWSAWQEIGGTTNTHLSAVAFGGDLHLFSKGLDNRMYSLIRGRNNHWSPWYPVTPITGTTDTGVAVARFDNTLHLFTRGVGDKKIYTQSVYVYPLPFGDDGLWSGGGNWDDPSGGHGVEQLFSYDFTHPVGGEIRAVRAGKVVFIENNALNTMQDPNAPGYGTVVVLRHADGTSSIYNHLQFNGIQVSCQQQVAQGQVIASSGDTGQSSTPHLHFGIGSVANFKDDCKTFTAEVPAPMPAYFKDKNHTAWRPISGDLLASSNG